MTKLFLIASFLFIFLQTEIIKPEEAKNYVGKEVVVRGKAVNTFLSADSKGKPLFINFCDIYPNQCFSVVIFTENTAIPTEMLENFTLKTLNYSGLIKLYREKPDMEISDLSKISE